MPCAVVPSAQALDPAVVEQLRVVIHLPASLEKLAGLRACDALDITERAEQGPQDDEHAQRVPESSIHSD